MPEQRNYADTCVAAMHSVGQTLAELPADFLSPEVSCVLIVRSNVLALYHLIFARAVHLLMPCFYTIIHPVDIDCDDRRPLELNARSSFRLQLWMSKCHAMDFGARLSS